MIQTTEEAQEDAPTLFQAISSVIFLQDKLAFSPINPTRGDKWPTLPARANTAYAVPELTETAALDPATPTAVRSSKRDSNRA